MPPRITYELTALGHALRQPIEVFGRGAIENESRITVAHIWFDGRDKTT